MESVAALKSTVEQVPITSASTAIPSSHAREGAGAVAQLSAPESHPSIDKSERESREKLERIAQAMDDYVRASQRSLEIQIHSGTGKTIVRVVSKEDGRVIREIPTEKVLNLAARMEELLGFLFDKRI